MSQWNTVCQLADIVPATGVCALLNNQQIAIFRPRADEQIYAISNIDPFFEASVLSRGIIAEHDGDVGGGGVFLQAAAFGQVHEREAAEHHADEAAEDRDDHAAHDRAAKAAEEGHPSGGGGSAAATACPRRRG